MAVQEVDAFAGGPGLPVPSWDSIWDALPKGQRKVRGIVLPQAHPGSEKKNIAPGTLVAWLDTQQTDMETGELKWFDDDPDKPRGTYHEQPMPQAEYVIQTETRDMHDYSAERRKTAEEDGEEDDGIRRLIIKGATGSKSMKRNAKHTFGSLGGRPPIGCYIEYELLERKPIPGSKFKENITVCTFDLPDAASLAVVEEYKAQMFPEVPADADKEPDAFGGETPARHGASSVSAEDDGTDAEPPPF
jgi:hypothetical protein